MDSNDDNILDMKTIKKILHRNAMLEPVRKQALDDMAEDRCQNQCRAIRAGYLLLASYGFAGTELRKNWRKNYAGF